MTLIDLPVGSIVTDKKTKFNNKPIEWIVTDHEKYQGGAVLLSKDILCCRPFDEPKECYVDEYRKKYGSNRWTDSDIREWLETEFYRKSFSSKLAALAKPVWNVTELSKYDRGLYGCAKDVTEDTVFLLSDAEVGCYGDNEALELFRGNTKEKYLITEVCPGLTWYWWLRSPFAGYSYYARIVNTGGSLINNYAYYGSNGVRPACVISSSAPVKKRKSGGYKFDWER